MTTSAPVHLALFIGSQPAIAPAWLHFFSSVGIKIAGAADAKEGVQALRESCFSLVLIDQSIDDKTEQRLRAEAISMAREGFAMPSIFRWPAMEKAACETAELSDTFLDLVIENMPSMITVKDARNLKIVRFNRAGEKLIGMDRKQILGKTDYEIYPKHQAEFFTRNDRFVADFGEIVDVEEEPIESAGNGTRILHTKKIPIMDAAGKPMYVLAISEDVTERKKAEEERMRLLREQTELEVKESSARRAAFLAEASTILSSNLDFRSCLNKMARLAVPAIADWAVVTLRDEGTKVETVAMIHRNSTKEVLLRAVVESYRKNADDPLNVRADLLAGRSSFLPFLTDETMREVAGTEELFALWKEVGCRSVLIVPIVARGKVFGSFCLVSCEASRRFRQEDLLVAEELGRRAGTALDNAMLYDTAKKAVEVRDNFLSIASHELKTPLTSLKLQIQTFKRRVNPDEGTAPSPKCLQDMLVRSEVQINRLARLIDDLLDVSRIEAGKLMIFPARVSLNRLIEESLAAFQEEARAANCQITFFAEQEIHLTCDPFRMEQVFGNLLTNAFKYGRGCPIEISLRKTAEGIFFEVRDHGMGIRSERLGQIFERFERAETHQGIAGLGLGLFIVRNIVQAHGGSVSVQSSVGEGSCFRVQIPGGEAQPLAKQASA
jgi:PAS domain S-box-containing protein